MSDDVLLAPSPKAATQFSDARVAWDEAMALVPPHIHIKLNLHQIHTLVGWDIDAQFPTARKKLKLDEGDPIRAEIVFVDGVMMYRYRG